MSKRRVSLGVTVAASNNAVNNTDSLMSLVQKIAENAKYNPEKDPGIKDFRAKLKAVSKVN